MLNDNNGLTNTKEDPELSADLYSHLAKYYDKVGEKHAMDLSQARKKCEKSLPPATRGRSLTPIVEIRPVEIRDNLKSSDPDSPDGFTIIPRENENNWHNLINLELAYLVLKEYKKKLDETKDILCKLNQRRTQLITRGKKKNYLES
ncbi:4701_t:CDS:2 [Rhizophagus irregularis]|nr:4701_t:CDS:2 [Rhizophagus irregularis]